MKVLLINVVCGIRSTGRICTDLAEELEKQGHEVKIAYGREEVPEQYKKYAIKIGGMANTKIHALKARVLDNSGFGSRYATTRFIEWVKVFDPDLIHIHNIHGYYINVGILFEYLRSCGKKIIWTLHDCWSFTGHCAYFDYANCDKWKIECGGCSEQRQYPASFVLDRSSTNFVNKKELFTEIPNLQIVTPSKWLAGLVKQSFLKKYPISVINNGINTASFKPTNSNIKAQLNCEDKKMILGVASIWDRRKGLDGFIKLSKMLSDDYQIVLIGLKDDQIAKLPKKIIGIKNTNSTEELAQLYTAAEVYVNTTLEDNYPTTNLEAIACGTPVITFETGGSPESARLFGMSVPKGDIEELKNAIESIEQIKPINDINVDFRNTVHNYMELYNGV